MRNITSSAEIKRIRRRGSPFRGDYVTLVALRGEPGVGVICGSSVGGAVSRNRARRRIKSYLREKGVPGGGGMSALLICKRRADRIDYQLLVRELDGLFERALEWCDSG